MDTETVTKYDVLVNVGKRTQIEQIITDVFGTINNKEYWKYRIQKAIFIYPHRWPEIIDLNTRLYMPELVKASRLYQPATAKVIADDAWRHPFSGYSDWLTTDVTFESR